MGELAPHLVAQHRGRIEVTAAAAVACAEFCTHRRTSPKASSIGSSNTAPASAGPGTGFGFSGLILARPIWARRQCQLKTDKPMRVVPSLAVHSFRESLPSR